MAIANLILPVQFEDKCTPPEKPRSFQYHPHVEARLGGHQKQMKCLTIISAGTQQPLVADAVPIPLRRATEQMAASPLEGRY